MKHILFSLLILFSLVGCMKKSQAIVSNVDEREANIIIVFLESKGITASKGEMSTAGAVGGGPTTPKFNIFVDAADEVRAMSILNSNGLPRRQGVNLLQLFAAQGLMTTATEENIRYQAGLTSQITNMILMIDGVIDANVQISFPEQTSVGGGAVATTPQKVTASVYVKHQGIMDDPNSHLEMKIKRLVAGSIQGLDMNDVTIVSDRSRLTDITINGERMGGGKPEEYVKIWSMVISKDSARQFRSIFVMLLLGLILLALIAGWMMWKVYPIIRTNGGIVQFFNPIPFLKRKKASTPPPEEIK